jgi:hypothetical protein
MADTPARRLAAKVARQREVGSMVVKLGVCGDWPEVLEHLNWLRPGEFLRAPGMRRYLVERDVSKLSAAHQAGLAQTQQQQKLSDAADAVAASSGWAFLQQLGSG